MTFQLTSIAPKLPMLDPAATRNFYVDQLSFTLVNDYGDYLMLRKDNVELHLFLLPTLNPLDNYGMCYMRISGIDAFYQTCLTHNILAKQGQLEERPWGVREFSIVDVNGNLLTFGESS
ncbi:VOC family protein [Nibrella saemangeumensis]|uniref:Bleomycin resistance protein n=1 Tax=Nibrella saemangeumensis TaxID=1084526 RepID=A0ABP8NNV5_9BACT